MMQPVKKKYIKQKNETNHVTSQNCVCPTICMGRDIQCLPYSAVQVQAFLTTN